MIGELSDTNSIHQVSTSIPIGNKLPRMRVGTDDFKTLLLNSDVFVDKSLMIKELLEDSGDVILITRPRRWGKSLNMNMLQKFFEIEVDEDGRPLPEGEKINNKLFWGGIVDLGFDETKELKPLKIASIANAIKRQGQFPVISINFKDVKGSSYQEIESKIQMQIIKLYGRHRYLEKYCQESVKLLSNSQKQQLTRYLNGNVSKLDIENTPCSTFF